MADEIGPAETADGTSRRRRPVNLAHEQPFAFGLLTIDPGTRRIALADGREEFLEPRIMQVLVALIQADGAILTRDELVERCWNGRIVGEDAITRVMSRLRRLAASLGSGVFTIETLTKVGYRLVATGTDEVAPPRSSERATQAGTMFTRRTFLAAGAAAGVAGLAGGGALLYQHLRPPSPPPEVEALMAQAWQAWTQGTGDGNSQAIGLYQRAIEIAPAYADAWGLLGCAYGDRSHFWVRAAEREPLRQRARAAGERALDFDPKNAYGRGAIAYARPLMGNWLAMQREFIQGLEDQPDKWVMTFSLGVSYTWVGRFTDAAALFEQVRHIAPTANQFVHQAISLWGAGRLDEADRLMDEAMVIYATSPGIWYTRFNLLMFSGRTSAAIAMARNAGVRPTYLSEEDIERNVSVAQALENRDPAQVAAAMTAQIQRAREAAGLASFAITVASALGRIDDAFMLADAYYFSRGFVIPDNKLPAGQTPDVSLNERSTRFLFLPPTRAMRADPRFATLVHELGLEQYWIEADTQPDFRKIPNS